MALDPALLEVESQDLVIFPSGSVARNAAAILLELGMLMLLHPKWKDWSCVTIATKPDAPDHEDAAIIIRITQLPCHEQSALVTMIGSRSLLNPWSATSVSVAGSSCAKSTSLRSFVPFYQSADMV